MMAYAEDTVKVSVGTQTYLCTLTSQLTCNPTNQVQQQVMNLKKNGGKIQIADKERGLSADIDTSLDHNNVIYDLTLCSDKTCSISTVNSDAVGNINQLMLGQYNITEKSFYVLGFFINSQGKAMDFEAALLKKFHHLQ